MADKRDPCTAENPHFLNTKDTRRMWQGVPAITDYKPSPRARDGDATLPNVLNDFYARFEAQNDVTTRKSTPPPNDQTVRIGHYTSNIIPQSTGAPQPTAVHTADP
ncbi:hypothetical protein SKAU_G00295420 [Synaphobranchus kaupii]|uniref:Uncharacterized protein n=1 Tax=Synaphobranchus kaupii TaxID=118154 RepID=A0A9Q1EUN5_SYNKA|nr:hypothetical protein SKAU_G00295420 [Synaphobranchus kaupii]